MFSFEKLSVISEFMLQKTKEKNLFFFLVLKHGKSCEIMVVWTGPLIISSYYCFVDDMMSLEKIA